MDVPDVPVLLCVLSVQKEILSDALAANFNPLALLYHQLLTVRTRYWYPLTQVTKPQI